MAATTGKKCDLSNVTVAHGSTVHVQQDTITTIYQKCISLHFPNGDAFNYCACTVSALYCRYRTLDAPSISTLSVTCK